MASGSRTRAEPCIRQSFCLHVSLEGFMLSQGLVSSVDLVFFHSAM